MQKFLNTLLKTQWPGFRVGHHAVLPPEEPCYGSLKDPLPAVLEGALSRMGIRRLYRHQALAIENIRSGANTVVATPTSSGKSLIYNLAVAEALIRNPGGSGLYLFPIKALSRDQMETLDDFLTFSPTGHKEDRIRAALYDGDTTPYQRAKIRQAPPHILLTNPDMLHYALLPFHGKWESFWRSLRFVVVDEMHTYRGVFGSHVAHVFRRLRRICRWYGSDPQFILLSATIANPEDLGRQLIGDCSRPMNVIGDYGSPQAKRHFVFLQTEEGSPYNASGMAARLIVKAAEAGLKTIAFTQSRRLTELVHMSVLRMKPALANRISSYRAGYLPEDRRTIEQNLSSGSLAAVISTSALEMGIDIGGLDLCILVGYPGTVMTTWQRGGRVGRSGRESAIVLLPQPDALDQYIARHPEAFLSSQYEIAVIDPENEEILKAHLPCAAWELPLSKADLAREKEGFRKVVDRLTDDGKLLVTADGDEWISSIHQPHRHVDIRSIGASYAIVRASDGDRQVPLGRTEGLRALKECHPGAVYLHRGESYQVDELDLEKRVIHVSQCRLPYFTRVKSDKETEILQVIASKPVDNFLVRLGRLRVTERITGFEMRRLFSQELLGTNELDLPPQVFETIGFWIEMEPALARRIKESKLHFMGGIHAVEHAAISMFPLFALCDRNDIGGISIPLHPQVGKGAVFIYDGYPGGIGLAAKGYTLISDLLRKTRELIASCPCSEGCPACIHSPKCGAGNKPLDKQAALAVLNYLTGEWSLFDAALDAGKENFDAIQAVVPVSPEPPPLRIGFLDIETQRLAAEVGGWKNKHLMRVSVAVLYDTHSGEFRSYREADVPKLIEDLQEFDLIVGFNILSFDYQVLKAYAPQGLDHLPTLDILHEIHALTGLRVSLGHLAEKTLGCSKTSDGIQAVQWFREGRWDDLIRYCTADVAITRDLFSFARENGYLLYADRQERLLRIPAQWDLEKYVRNRETANIPVRLH